ncbi:Abi family protein [Abyssicoccus albus]|uniref:Abi-like protein n=1 Tax=Abyssicoccus albus TaxID=1817405 RepID=A0A3N5BG70_9BACL|nr:Abi family protein [Abyssicoccus albus]RPF56716.1 Abi-like protein [Abyssicoccus albus]
MNTQKIKFDYNEMINYFHTKGITSELTNSQMIYQLSTKTYFYKFISYRKNFDKKENNQYINLSFEILQDLASIDVDLRYLVIKMSLDIEHQLKTIIMNEITKNKSEDGYSIIYKFIATSKDPTNTKKQLMINNKKSIYNQQFYEKYHTDPPIWVAFESMSFGLLIDFTDFYISHYPNTSIKALHPLLYSVRHLRNNAAHSSPILNQITEKNFYDHSRTVTQYVNRYIGKTSTRNKLRVQKIYDLTSLIILYEYLMPNSRLKRERKKEIIGFLKRVKKNSHYYSKHIQLETVYLYFIKLILKKSK